MPIIKRSLLTNTTDITYRKCFATGYVAILIQETSVFKWKRTGPFKNLPLSPQCPVWRRSPVFFRKWLIVSSLFPPNEYFQSPFPRVPVDQCGARFVIPAERQHEPPLEPTDAHAQLLSGWVDACTRSDIGMVSDGGKLYSKRHAILFREDKAWKSAAPCIMQFLQVCMSLHCSVAYIKHICLKVWRRKKINRPFIFNLGTNKAVISFIIKLSVFYNKI